MKYYESHESAYQKRLAQGHVMWDEGSYEKPYTRGFVERLLKETDAAPDGARILVLGCGTGPLACILAAKGYRVTGVDISATAIAFAKRQAAERKLDVDFLVGDTCKPPANAGAYDLAIDDHLLHCIVQPKDRADTFNAARTALKPGGEFWIETMIGHPAVPLSETFNADEKGVCWSKVPESMRSPECVERNGTLWMPTRLIHVSHELVLNEVKAAGFEVLWHEVQLQEEEGAPAQLVARCRRG